MSRRILAGFGFRRAPEKTINEMKSSCNTPMGLLEIRTLGHASVQLRLGRDILYVDPYSQVYDFSTLPKATAVLITHDHYDHLDRKALEPLLGPSTTVIGNPDVARVLPGTVSLRNGEMTSCCGIAVKAVPAYNTTGRNEDGEFFHPKGVGNGYLLDMDGFRVYFAGDTELIPEMAACQGVDVAFLPKNLPYTMSDGMFVEAARAIAPKILYPYHYFEVDIEALRAALPQMEVRL